MSQTSVLPELKEILGALIFGANRPLSTKEMRKCLAEVAQTVGGETTAFGSVRDADVEAALGELRVKLEQMRCGFMLTEVAGGFRLVSSANCGKWLKHLLNARPSRLSQPALETLAIIAYRQPISRADIEAIRGVNVDHIMKTLLEMQLVKISGRSELPGRPFLYGTTHAFLEHFGLKDVKQLDQMEPMLLAARERARIQAEAKAQEEPQPAAEAQAAETTGAAAAAQPGQPSTDQQKKEDSTNENNLTN
ncbi:MAG: SMC-Scp complex subunit ScpB [Verrucomicrobia bacterium]|nr:SMC-Scp complex subunit ScpB [Verrucomicrobiota bacterium]